MWIRTQGGYLLNLDRMEHVNYIENLNQTIAYGESKAHVISEGNILETITGAIRCNTTILEVRDYVRN